MKLLIHLFLCAASRACNRACDGYRIGGGVWRPDVLDVSGTGSNLYVMLLAPTGTAMNTARSALPALAAMFSPTRGRGTGVAGMLGIGRFGGIAGSVLVAELGRRQFGTAGVFLVIAVPVLIATLAILTKAWPGPASPMIRSIPDVKPVSTFTGIALGCPGALARPLSRARHRLSLAAGRRRLRRRRPAIRHRRRAPFRSHSARRGRRETPPPAQCPPAAPGSPGECDGGCGRG